MIDKIKHIFQKEPEENSLLEDLRQRNIELRGAVEQLKIEKSEISAEAQKINLELEKIKKENETLRKYYDLDKEPSDEIKMKIHIDLEINRMREEMLKLVVLQSQQPIYYMPPIYPPSGIRF